MAVTHDLVLNALKGLGNSPDVARRLFDWVSETRGELLSSKVYNFMCGILGSNGYVNEFWGLVEMMKSKGYGVKKGTYDRVFEKFEKEGLGSDLERLKKLYDSGSVDSSVEKVCSRIFNVIRGQVWGDEVERELRELGELKGVFDSEVIAMVLTKLKFEPNKGLIFFRWIEESNLFKHDEATYNAMAMVLAREDCVDKFWKVVSEMRGVGLELKKEMYIDVLMKFVRRRMIKDAVDLYEFAMCGATKPSVPDCTLLLRKVVAGKELDMDSFQKTVRAFTQGGNRLTNPILNAVIKSLISVGRVGECNKILKAMGEVGFSPSEGLQKKIAYTLSRKGEKEAAAEFMDYIGSSGSNLNSKTWASLVEGHCARGDLGEASNCFRTMVEKEGASGASYALDMLVNLYGRQNRAIDAYKLLHDMVNENELKPWHSTYKVLISKLLVQGGFEESLNLLGLMKNHGFPPFLDPVIEYVSKIGTADEAMAFLNAMTVKKVPSTSVFLRVFEAFLKAGRHNEAHNLLSKCPRFIRDHADVLNLFFAMKADIEPAVTTVAA